MTDDIVARLRIYEWAHPVIKEAADEIERLQAALTQIEKSAVHGIEHYQGAVAQKIVREVLLIARDALAKEGKP